MEEEEEEEEEDEDEEEEREVRVLRWRLILSGRGTCRAVKVSFFVVTVLHLRHFTVEVVCPLKSSVIAETDLGAGWMSSLS